MNNKGEHGLVIYQGREKKAVNVTPLSGFWNAQLNVPPKFPPLFATQGLFPYMLYKALVLVMWGYFLVKIYVKNLFTVSQYCFLLLNIQPLMQPSSAAHMNSPFS